MTQAGGPAALNGFLYQILHHLNSMANVRLTGRLDRKILRDARLTLEPRTGGDARVEAKGLYLVEQYKTRTTRTWSLKDLFPVLIDLQNSVPHSVAGTAIYRFVTDGKPGKLQPFKEFLKEVRSVSSLEDLENTRSIRFSPSITATRRKFFEYLSTEIQRSTSASAEIVNPRLFHLLSNFEMKFRIDGTNIAISVEHLLRLYAPNLGDESHLREQLIGILLDTVRTGEVTLDVHGIDALFRRTGINTERMRKLAALPATTASTTWRNLNRVKYNVEQDVRRRPLWPENKQILVIEGESGNGKTWQLGQLLHACVESSQIVALILHARTREDLFVQISQQLWQTGLGETSNMSPIGISNFMRELTATDPQRAITIAVDDVQDTDFARELVRQEWANWGMRLVLTVPRRVARSLSITDGSLVHFHSVGEFSIEELDSLLRVSGRRWSELPADLRHLLRRPILAGIYIELPYSSIKTAPQSEYEIFERFWERISARSGHGDEGVAIALANHVLDTESFSLERSEWSQIGVFSNDIVDRLVASGWIYITNNGAMTFAHDRLLNWAAAKALVHKFDRGALTEEELSEALIGQTTDEGSQFDFRLGYVPMDVLWLLAEDSHKRTSLTTLIRRLEDRQDFGPAGQMLYAHLLPTIGQTIVPILVELVTQRCHDTNHGLRVKHISRAFITLARQENVCLQSAIEILLRSHDYDVQDVALQTLPLLPDMNPIERIWDIHQQRQTDLMRETEHSRYERYRIGFATMCSAIQSQPSWLHEKLADSKSSPTDVSECAFLLAALDGPAAQDIWRDTRDIVVQMCHESQPRGLLRCIGRFSDISLIEFAVQSLTSTNSFAGSAALNTLSILDPKTAIDRLVDVGDTDRYLSRNNWLPVLLNAEPDLTNRGILKLASCDSRGLRTIVDLFWERPNDADDKIIRFVVETLEKEISKNFQTCMVGDAIWLYHPLDFLGRISQLELLRILWEKVGSSLEEMLIEIAAVRSCRGGEGHDTIAEKVRRVLLLMGGGGIAALIERELESDDIHARIRGLNWAAVRGGVRIQDRLSAIATRSFERCVDGGVHDLALHEFRLSVSALSANGPDAALVNVVMQSGVVDLPPKLSQFRSHRGMMVRDETATALEILENLDEGQIQIALIVAWLGMDPVFIEPVQRILERTDPNGKTAVFAILALLELGDNSEQLVRLAFRMASTDKNSVWGVRALLRLGEAGISSLASWLQERSCGNCNELGIAVIRALYKNVSTREIAVREAVECCKDGMFLPGPPYDVAAEWNDLVLREKILDKAFSARSPFDNHLLRAIEGLAKFDVMRAEEALEIAVQLHPKMEYRLCKILIDIAPESAASKLIEWAFTVQRESLTLAVGRALRRLDWDVVAELLMSRTDGSLAERKLAANLGAAIPTHNLRVALDRMAKYDDVDEVRHAALAAIDCHRRESDLCELFEAFSSGTLERRWSLLHSIVHSGDPYLFTERTDPLWLGNILTDDIPFAFEHHGNIILRERRRSGR